MDRVQIDSQPKRSGLRTALIVFCAAALGCLFAIWIAKTYIFIDAFKPTRLSDDELKVLQSKVEVLIPSGTKGTARPRMKDSAVSVEGGQGHDLTPEPYSEANAVREIRLTERELNGLLARNTDLAQKLVIDLSDDLASAKLLIPLPADFPFFGGKVVRVTAGIELRYADHNPVVMVKGVSIWGVPIPNAWLGGIKNRDLVSEYGAGEGFWRSFSAGVEDIRIREGHLSITLKP